MIIGETPDSKEISEGVLLAGKSGFVLKNWIMRVVPSVQVAYEQKRVSVCNVLKCLSPESQGKAYPIGAIREQAEKHCSQYLNIGDAKTVILMGEAPQRYYFAKELEQEDTVDRALGHSTKGTSGRIGRVYERDGKRWVFAPLPSAVLKQPALATHAQEAFRIATGENKLLVPNYLPWDVAVLGLCK